MTHCKFSSLASFMNECQVSGALPNHVSDSIYHVMAS